MNAAARRSPVGWYRASARAAVLSTLVAAIAWTGQEASADTIHPAPETESAETWRSEGQRTVERLKSIRPINGPARNVILFLGDGMGVATVTAARIRAGQLQGRSGEENLLSFETFPHLALSKTYNTNQQTPDSAGTMTAIMTGVKTRAGVIAVDQSVARGDCAGSIGHELTTLLEQAELAGLSTGIVTTARLTHGTPAAAFAHAPDRQWEDDTRTEPPCVDIAAQLVEFAERHPGSDGIEVALGGGRRHFLPRGATDPEGGTGWRGDGRDLAAEWTGRHEDAAYVWNRAQLAEIDAAETAHLLGLFDPSHMAFEHDRADDHAGEPPLTEMTESAIRLLQRNPKGYFLLVEAGRIDHGHHDGNAYRALGETIEFARAVERAVTLTVETETLIVVTADHSHVMTIGGYSTRGNDILGKTLGNNAAGNPAGLSRDALGLPYATLGYHNGPGYSGESQDQAEGPKRFPHSAAGFTGIARGRADLTDTDTTAASHLQEAAIPMRWESHGGEDVAIYARGPMAYLFRGTLEQNVIYHIMHEALRASLGEEHDPP